MHPEMSPLFNIHQTLELLGLQNPSASPFQLPFPIVVVLKVHILQCAKPFPTPDESFFVLFWIASQYMENGMGTGQKPSVLQS